MTDAQLGRLVHAAFDGAGFADTIRDRLCDAVQTVIGDAGPERDACAGRAAAEELATVLIARSHGRTRPKDAANGPAQIEQRAHAFRAMAGVRV